MWIKIRKELCLINFGMINSRINVSSKTPDKKYVHQSFSLIFFSSVIPYLLKRKREIKIIVKF